jgi:hypothetical protein
MTAPDELIGRYHDLLGRGPLAADSWACLSDQLARRGLFFGPRPLCNVLRPRFLSAEQDRLLRSRAGILATALRRMQEVVLADPAIRKRFGLMGWEEAVLDIPSRLTHPCPISRFDGFFTADGRLRFTEINAQSPAGAGFNDALAAAFRELPVMAEFAKEVPLSIPSTRGGTLAALRAAFQDWSGDAAAVPELAIVDWSDVPTRPDFLLLQEHFRKEGLPTRVVSPLDLAFDGEKLTADGEVITLVYRRVLMVELYDRCGLTHPLVEAARAGAVCVVNPLASRVIGKKASFAFLSDEENGDWFTPLQRAAIRDNVPWTRFVEDRKTSIAGHAIDLIPFVLKNKDRLVLKPNDAYGGRAVVLGWTATAESWEAAVATALGEPYVVQERIDLPTEDYPLIESGALAFAPRWVDTCPFLGPDDAVFGCLTRLSTEPLVNVTTGGGAMVPTFVVGQ